MNILSSTYPLSTYSRVYVAFVSNGALSIPEWVSSDYTKVNHSIKLSEEAHMELWKRNKACK